MPTYVYAITEAGHPLDLDGLEGVGDPPNELRTLRGGSVAAVVSDAPEDLRANRRDVSAHHEVQERLLKDGAVLPLRFGLMAPDDKAVEAELAERADQYARRLKKLEGRVELNLKVSQEEQQLLRDVLERSDEVRELNEAIRSGQGGQDASLALGELVAGLARQREEELARGIVGTLGQLSEGELIATPGKDDFLNVSFLVERDNVQEFAQAEQKLAEDYGEGFDFRLRGPIPPYSFV